jgi:CRISPR system Cascade subunit CasA
VEYNLLEQPWIPVRLADGRYQDVGLRDVFALAPQIRAISDPSPLVAAALYRLLLAVAHRVLNGPASVEEWAALWDAGAFPLAAVDAYFARVRDRFDLFHPERPFYQTSALAPFTPAPLSRLIHDVASGNNQTLFDHTTDRHAPTLSPAQAARYLVAHQAFAVGGTLAHEPGRQQDKYSKAAPLLKCAVVVVRGPSLARTLILNLHRYNTTDAEPFAATPDDCPAWERDVPTVVEQRCPTGYLDLLTWQSRRILLCPTPQADGTAAVTGVVIMNGASFASNVLNRDVETMAAFRTVKRPSDDLFPPLGFREDRALWRDSLALFEATGTEYARPRLLSWLSTLVDMAVLSRADVMHLDIFGICTDRARLVLWRHERLPLPLDILGDADLIGALKTALEKAARGAEALSRAVWMAARLLIAPESTLPGGRMPPRQEVADVAASMGASNAYWARLEVPFKQFVLRVHQAGSEAAAQASAESPLGQWVETVSRTAREAFDEATRELTDAGRELKAVTIAARVLRAALRDEVALPRAETTEGA